MKLAVVYHSETGNTRRMAELIADGARRLDGVEAAIMAVEGLDRDFLREAQVVVLGCPTYEGSPSWQMKRFLDTVDVDLAGKLGGAFASQNWPGGGGADFAEMTMIAAALVLGMLIYSGGVKEGYPPLHFGAVSQKAPSSDIDRERAVKLGENIASMAKKLF